MITNNPDQQYTTIEIASLDRPGLLAEIGSIFSDLSIILESAKITTLGERVEDIFYVTSANGKPITDKDWCERITQEIKRQLDHNSWRQPD